MGERELTVKESARACREAIEAMGAAGDEPMRVQTLGGMFTVGWDERGSATALGQLAFFAEFLQATGLFERWREQCPLGYSSPNAPTVADVLGTWLLSILDGQSRYAHVGSLRGDGVAVQVLGMRKVVSDDSLRRALAALAPATEAGHSVEQRAAQQAQAARAVRWMQEHLRHSVGEATATAWILDCDSTVKPLYGRQAGAEVSFNPHKPGRPSHVIHTYWIGNLRLVLDAQLEPGKRHAPVHVRPGLVTLIESLPAGHRPRLVRGDCAFGSEGEMAALEALGQPYLFKLRQSAGVRKLVQRQWRRQTWCELGQGWQGCEDELRLLGWSRARRVIVMRRARPVDVLVETRRRRGRAQEQAELVFLDANEPARSWEYAVLVGGTAYPLQSIGQLYRDRADCENGFDEIKNQWGWGGYSTQDIERCALTARAVALVYNWWSWYVRLAHPQARLEAVSSRPKLLAAIGRLSRHAGQSRILLTVTHEAVAQVKRLIANVRAGLRHLEAAAPQLDKPQRWLALVRYIVERILAARHPPHPASLVFGSG
jgi:hypothetical protein